MHAALLSILILCACGGSSAEPSAAPLTTPSKRAWPSDSQVDCAGPMAHKCGRGRRKARPEPALRQEEPQKKAVPEAVEAGPQVYKVALENEQVRVLIASYQPGSKVPMHRHPDHVVFALTGGKRVSSRTGDASGGEEAEVSSGAAVFEKAGMHEVEVAGATATRAILVELGGKPGASRPAGDDPVAAQRRVHKLLLDQPRVRVLDVTFGKGKSKPAALGDHVLLARDKGTLVWTAAGGAAQTLELEPGEVLFFPAGVYNAINGKRESFEVVLFELKAP